ncbi:Broad specificity phosphatase PhoE [Pseudonocardia thermophila]|uniref:Broad specificity phosphatase PhoE n=1 Tax=Pseudonocardia thermophila TaxID=1848 RepID=A0A1M6RAV2_PSETH|nr:Broad specificity phosphatase PhoE [Pseudonocardia thermophila]
MLLRHGETHGYDDDHGLTERGEQQATARGAELADEITPGTIVRMPHARTARATATAVALRAALVAKLGHEDGIGPLYPEPFFDNLRYSLHGETVDTTGGAAPARLALPPGELPEWAREYDRFDSDFRAGAAAGNPIEYWLRNPTLYFEPPQIAAHRMWRGVATAADGHDPAGGPLLVLASTHSAPMRAFVATTIGSDPGEPHNLEDVRVRVRQDGSARVSFREHVVETSIPGHLPPWIDRTWFETFGR